MKIIKVVSNSIILCMLFAFSIFQNDVNASSLIEKDNFKKGADSSYYEPSGPYLMVNVVGLDKEGDVRLYPRYMEFNIKPGTILTKEKIENYVERTLDGTRYRKFRVVELAPNSKVVVSYYNEQEKKEETKSFPITEEGFVVPDLSKHTENPGFNLITNVVIEERFPK